MSSSNTFELLERLLCRLGVTLHKSSPQFLALHSHFLFSFWRPLPPKANTTPFSSTSWFYNIMRSRKAATQAMTATSRSLNLDFIILEWGIWGGNAEVVPSHGVVKSSRYDDLLRPRLDLLVFLWSDCIHLSSVVWDSSFEGLLAWSPGNSGRLEDPTICCARKCGLSVSKSSTLASVPRPPTDDLHHQRQLQPCATLPIHLLGKYHPV